MTYLWLVAGMVLLVAGADFLVRGGVALARRLGVSALLIGLTIVAWGTSAPELVVSVRAAVGGTADVAVGNVIGSSIFNILLILGVTAVLQPIACPPAAILRDGSFALAAVLLFIVIALVHGTVMPWHGHGMLGFLLIILVVTYMTERVSTSGAAERLRAEAKETAAAGTLLLSLLFVPMGIGLLVVGADLMVDSAVEIARTVGISETVIGLTLVAAGTGLPELATSAVAAVRRHADVALGNVIGSNVLNILAGLGAASVVRPIPIPEQIMSFDMWLLLGVTLALLPPVFLKNRIGRVYGGLFLVLYVAYVAALATGRIGAAGPAS